MGINLGSNAISALKLGTTTIDKVYLGNAQVYSASPGPAPTPAELYGVLYCYEWSSEWYIVNEPEGCSITIVDNDKLNAFLTSVSVEGDTYLNFEYDGDGGWICNWEGEPIPTADMPSTTGISVTLDDPNWAMFEIDLMSTIDTTSTPFPIVLPDEHGVEKLYSLYYLGIYTEPVPGDAVVSFSFGSTTTETPSSGFLPFCTNLVSISFDNASSLERIGNNFLMGCTSFNAQFTLPDSLTEVGESFMRGCSSFTGPLVCNSPSSATGLTYSDYTLGTSNPSDAMFATGVTLTGPYATVWKNKFPDLNDQAYIHYRKLIVSQ